MAEPDAAGHAPDGNAGPRPKRSRPLSIAEAARQMERQRAPLVAEIERAAKERRWIDAEFGLEDSDAKASTAEPSPATEPVHTPAASPEPERWKPPASTDPEIAAGWAPYERRDAPAWLVERIREWWRPFEPGVVEHWIRLEREIKNLRHELRADQRTHEEFHNARLTWSAEDLVDYMEGTRMIPKRDRPHPGRPRKRQADLDVHQWIAAQALADPSFRHLSQKEAEARGPFKARTIGTSPVWKEMKRVVAEVAEAAAERAREEFGSRVGEDEDNIGMRVGRKHGIGRQRTTQADRDHHRAAEDLINEADAAKRKKHAQ